MGCDPARAETKGKAYLTRSGFNRIPRTGRWSVGLKSEECPDTDVEGGIETLLGRVTGDLAIWDELSRSCNMDVFCGLFCLAGNRGFELSVEMSKMLADRHLTVGFDVYFQPAKDGSE